MEPKSTSRYILTALSIVLVFTAFLMVALNAFNLQKNFGSISNVRLTNTGDKYRDGFLAARALYANQCPNVNRQSNTISGSVQTVGNNKLTFEQNFFDTLQEIDGVSDTRTALIEGNSKILIQTAKSMDQLNKEIQAFKPSSGAVPPSPYIAKEGKLSDIKAGDRVTITSDKELRLATSFYAKTIQVMR